MKTMKLVDLAKTIRSKNAGTDRITFDIIFRDPQNYELVKKSGVLNRAFVAELFGIPDSRIADLWNLTRVMQSNLPSTACVPPVPLGRVIYLAANSTRLCWT